MDEVDLQLMKAIAANPQATQRELSEELGVSLGKANYCLKALTERGWVKVGNFWASLNKIAYAYLLTPRGFTSKRKLTASFLRRKAAEYEKPKREIAGLKAESARLARTGGQGCAH